MSKIRVLLAGAAVMGSLSLGAAPASASGWCNGYVDYDCYMYPSGWYCTVYTKLVAGGCVVGD